MSASIDIPRRSCQPHTDSTSSSTLSLYSVNMAHRASSSISSNNSTPRKSSGWGPYYEPRPRLLSSSLAKQEHTVINIGHPDGPPRLITCVKASQGFDWNQEIFLPSYLDYDSSLLERKPDPIHEIRVTDEEAKAMMPQ